MQGKAPSDAMNSHAARQRNTYKAERHSDQFTDTKRGTDCPYAWDDRYRRLAVNKTAGERASTLRTRSTAERQGVSTDERVRGRPRRVEVPTRLRRIYRVQKRTISIRRMVRSSLTNARCRIGELKTVPTVTAIGVSAGAGVGD